MDFTQIIYHTSAEHFVWALQEKARLDHTVVPPGKIVFLGSNPSCSSPYEDPFSHCKSANKMVNEWIPALGLTRKQVHFMNVANYKTWGNRALKGPEVKHEVKRLQLRLAGQVVITLGKTAKLAVDLSGTSILRGPVINLPHPSGRNRILNDREHVVQILAEAKAKLQEALNA